MVDIAAALEAENTNDAAVYGVIKLVGDRSDALDQFELAARRLVNLARYYRERST